MPSLLIITAILIWSSLGIIVRLAGTKILYAIFYPALVALIFQILFISLTNEKNKMPRTNKILPLFLLGPFLLTNHFLFFYAFANTTIANAVLTHYTAPVFVAIMAPLLLKEATDKIVVIAIVISSAGLLMLFKGVSLSAQHAAGIAAGILSGITYAFIIIIGRFVARDNSPWVVAAFQNFVIVILLLPFIRELPGSVSGYLVVMGLVHSTLAPILYFKGLRNVRAGKASVLGYLEPVGATVLAMIFFREVPATMSLFGGILIILSGYLMIKRRDSVNNQKEFSSQGIDNQ